MNLFRLFFLVCTYLFGFLTYRDQERRLWIILNGLIQMHSMAVPSHHLDFYLWLLYELKSLQFVSRVVCVGYIVNLYCLSYSFKSLFILSYMSWSWSHGSWIYNYLCNQCLSIQITKYVIKLSVTCERSVVFSRYSCFLHQKNWSPRYNSNIIESGIKHHTPPPRQEVHCSNRFHIITSNTLVKIRSTLYKAIPQCSLAMPKQGSTHLH